jgi:hypothetical protein
VSAGLDSWTITLFEHQPDFSNFCGQFSVNNLLGWPAFDWRRMKNAAARAAARSIIAEAGGWTALVSPMGHYHIRALIATIDAVFVDCFRWSQSHAQLHHEETPK